MTPSQAMGLVEWADALPMVYDPEKPWNRQPIDTEDIWAAWRRYLMLPQPREPKALARRLGCKLREAEALMIEGVFVGRAEKFDAWVMGLWEDKVKEIVTASAEHYSERHTRLLAMSLELAGHELEKLLLTSKSTTANTLKVPEVTKLLEGMIKLERLVHDESTENVATKIQLYDPMLASIEQIKNLKAMKAKCKVKP